MECPEDRTEKTVDRSSALSEEVMLEDVEVFIDHSGIYREGERSGPTYAYYGSAPGRA
ncbi:MAG: hypothetical protein IPO60_09960 [Flavobacteriales bacterium]|nr:hypothetical protein [Flavobacteriales bacterium]